MSGARRIGTGHRVMSIGLSVRRLSAPLALIFSIVLIVEAMTGPAGGVSDPIALLGGMRHPASLPIALTEGVIAAIAAIAAVRLLAFSAGALGWSLLPRAHRDLLARVSEGSSRRPDVAHPQ